MIRTSNNTGYFIEKYDIDFPAGAESVALADTIMQKGRPATAGSKILEGFISPLDATVVTKLEEAGFCIAGRTMVDEFGAAGLFTYFFDDYAHDAVKNNAAKFALCNDYTGAIGRYAAGDDLYYIHPTYGSVSRYGLIPSVCSMDQIGVISKTYQDGFRLLSVISGYDPKDGAMLEFSTTPGARSSKLRLGIPTNVLIKCMGFVSGGISDIDRGFDPVMFNLEYFGLYAQVMRILCCAELCGNISRYDGVKFGYRAKSYSNLRKLYTKSRTKGLGMEIKLAALIGAMVLSQEHYTRYYDKAMRIRRLIKESLRFDEYDLIMMPVPHGVPISRILEVTALPRLCGLPAVTIPYKGCEVTLVADAGREDVLFSALETIAAQG